MVPSLGYFGISFIYFPMHELDIKTRYPLFHYQMITQLQQTFIQEYNMSMPQTLLIATT